MQPQSQQPHPISYQPQLQKLLKYEQLYRLLLCKYKICIACTYRTFSIMTPKMYSDQHSQIKIMKEIYNLALGKCAEVGVKQSYKYYVGEFKMYCEMYEQEYHAKQQQKQHLKDQKQPIQLQQPSITPKSSDSQSPHPRITQKFCWLCSGILQQKQLTKYCRQIITKIKQQHYQSKNKYKLNVKVHNMLSIKYEVFCNLVLAELQKQQLYPYKNNNIIQGETTTTSTSNKQLEQIRKELISPLFQKTGLDIKTVFKWKLSNIINQQPAQIFTICSTINQDQDTVIVTLQLQHSSEIIQKQMTNLIGPYLHFQKVKDKGNKKGRVQLIENKNYQVVWTIGVINKICQISQNSWSQILQNYPIKTISDIEQLSAQCIHTKISLQSQNILFCGKYVKFSRYLSQTPWVINKERLIHSSLQDQIQKNIIKLFYPEKIVEKGAIQVKFHAGGREDIDVRMLKGGRPFVIQFVNPRKCLKDISLQTILENIKIDLPQRYPLLPKISPETSSQCSPQQLQTIKCTLLQFYINNSTQLAKVNTFKKTNSDYISKQLKQAQIQKIKHYVCYIKSLQQFTKQDKIKLQKLHNLAVLQKTPIRVLHRRTLMYRDKIVHKMIFHPTTRFSAILEIWASAGTYIKEFVHGDMNRTVPNVGSILGKEVDILQLDVGSLKEGEWVEGDDEKMKLGVLAWEKI